MLSVSDASFCAEFLASRFCSFAVGDVFLAQVQAQTQELPGERRKGCDLSLMGEGRGAIRSEAELAEGEGKAEVCGADEE